MMAGRDKAYLRILSGPKKGGVYVLADLSVFEIGKGDGCQVRLEGDKCAMNHARIYRKDDCWTFFDLNSEFGSYVNDISFSKRDLEGGEILRLGSMELQFSFEPPQAKSKEVDGADAGTATGEEAMPPASSPAMAAAEMAPPLPSDTRSALSPPPLPVVEPFGETEVSRDEDGDAAARLEEAVRLVVVDGDPRDIGKEFQFDRAQSLTIGRALQCDLLLNDGKVSRRHCMIEVEKGCLMLTDLGSSNGTVVNGEKVRRTVLQPGDYLRLGYTVISCQRIPQRVMT